MSKVIILGDVHLGAGLNIGKVGVGSNLNSRIIDQLNLLDWTLDQALEDNVSDIIITGDIFEDSKPHYFLITLFITWLKKCQHSHVHVHVIMGNHDLIRSGNHTSTPLDIIAKAELDGIEIYKNIDTVFIGTTAFTLIPFKDRKYYNSLSNTESLQLLQESVVYELSMIPTTYTKVVVGHLAIEGSIPVGNEIDDLSNELFCPIEMFRGYDYVWMGHVHNPQTMHKTNPLVAHVGSMDNSHFNLNDTFKHIVIFDTEQKSFITRQLPVRQLKYIVISVPEEIDDANTFVSQEISKISNLDKAIVKVEIDLATNNSLSFDKSKVYQQLSQCGVFHITTMIVNSKKAPAIKEIKTSNITANVDLTSAIELFFNSQVDESLRTEAKTLALQMVNKYKTGSKLV